MLDKSPVLGGKGLLTSKGHLTIANKTSTIAQSGAGAVRKHMPIAVAKQRQALQKPADNDSIGSGSYEDEYLSDGYLNGEEGEEESPQRKVSNSPM